MCKINNIDDCNVIIKDNTRHCQGGFSKPLGNYSAFEAELWEIYEGLKLTKRLEFKMVEINVNSKIIVKILENGNAMIIDGYALIKQIHV